MTGKLIIKIAIITALATLSLVALYALSQFNYLLFHGAVEFFSIVIAFTIFAVAWNNRRLMNNQYFLIIGVAFLFVTGLTLLHTLTYKGMGVFPGINANWATQLWIAARYLITLSMLGALLFLGKKPRPYLTIAGFAVVFTLVLSSIFYWQNFPLAYVDGVGLTVFKVASEFIVSTILLVTVAYLIKNRKSFSGSVLKYLVSAMLVIVAAEMSFTLYVDVYGFFNILGHLLTVVAFYLIYKAYIETGISKPYELIFHNLKQNELRLEKEIIERSKVEQALTSSKRLLENVFDSMYEGIVILDKTGKVVAFNNAFIGINKFKDREDMLKSIDSLGTVFRAYHLDGSYVPLEEWPATKALRGESGTDREYIVERTDIGICWMTSNSYAPLRDEKGEVIGAIQTMHDITERKRADEALKQRSKELEVTQKKLEENAILLKEYSNEMEELARQRLEKLKEAERLAAVGATAGMVGHDIRNPLQAITGDLYIAKTEAANLPDSEEKANIIDSLMETEKNIDYINKIVQDLQDYARPLNPRREQSDLKEIIGKLITKNGVPNNVKVTVKVADDARKISTDAYYLKRVLYNLVTNAVQAMPEGGKLEITVKKETGFTVITVADTGVGIPKDVQPKMFTVMFTTKSKGQGFGLPVVKRMTESLGGTVAFESQEGKGTIFKVLLPNNK